MLLKSLVFSEETSQRRNDDSRPLEYVLAIRVDAPSGFSQSVCAFQTPERYVFDLTNDNPSERFRIDALNSVNAVGVTQPGYLGPASFDHFTTLPEPSATLFGAIGFTAMLKRKSS